MHSKMLGWNLGKWLWGHFDNIKFGFGSQEHRHKFSSCSFLTSYGIHLDIIWSISKCSATIPKHISFVKHNAQFVQRGSRFKICKSAHNFVIIVHRSIIMVAKHFSHISADFFSFKDHIHKIQQHAYTYEQTYA